VNGLLHRRKTDIIGTLDSQKKKIWILQNNQVGITVSGKQNNIIKTRKFYVKKFVDKIVFCIDLILIRLLL